MIVTAVVMIFLFGISGANAEGLLPSLSETVGVAMPSLGEALQRYPDTESKENDGSTIQYWSDIKETDFDAFSEYLGKTGAMLQEYTVENGVFSAIIEKDNRTFSFVYNQQDKTAIVSYPQGTYDEYSSKAESHFISFKELYKTENKGKAIDELKLIANASLYTPLTEYLSNIGYETPDDFVNEIIIEEGFELLRTVSYEAAREKWDSVAGEKYKEKINDGIYSYATNLVEQNRIITAVKFLRKVDEERCNVLCARIESFICSLFIPDKKDSCYALKADGTLVTLDNKIIDRNIKKIEYLYGRRGIIALKTDGSVINKDNSGCWGKVDNNKWRNIVDIQGTYYVYVGLKDNGTVVAEWAEDQKDLNPKQYEAIVEKWSNIKQIAVMQKMVYGLKEDGTVVEAGKRYEGWANSTKEWRNIVEIVQNPTNEYLYGIGIDGMVFNNNATNKGALTVVDVIRESSINYGPVGADGKANIVITEERRKAAGTSRTAKMEYANSETNCLALPGGYNGYGIIKEDGTAIYLDYNNRVKALEAPWKLWKDEEELGQLFNLQYKIN